MNNTTDNEADPNPRGAGLRISGDVVNQATADLPDNQRSAIRRLHAHYDELSLSLDETAKLIGMETGSGLSQIFRGKYGAKLDNVVAAIESFFELQEKRRQSRKLEFIETHLTRRIWDVCDAAIEFQKFAFIYGDAQIGKSEALQAYAASHNHGSTIYLEMPTGGALSNFLVKLAEKLRIPTILRQTELRRRIIQAFDDRMLLIVDEAHQCIPVNGVGHRAVMSIEFVRELFNEAHCGVVICGTNVFRDAALSGPVEPILRQSLRRRLCALQLPNVPARVDLNAFAAGYGLEVSAGPARELEERVVNERGLGMWLTLLRMGAKVAAQRKQPLAWQHVITARAGLDWTEQKR